MSEPLSHEAKLWAIERILASHQNRWIERLAREAPTEAEGIKAVRRECSSMGSYTRERKIDCHYSHIDVQYHGQSGRLTWREVVRHARAPGHQVAFAGAPLDRC